MFARGAGLALVALLSGLCPGGALADGVAVDGAHVDRDHVAVAADALSAVVASSAEDGFPPEAVVDGKVGVPWVSRPEDREGARVTLRFAHVRWLSHVDVTVGHGRDNRTFRGYGRPRVIELVFGDGRRERYPMRDTRRPQRITFMSLAVTDSLTLVLRDVDGPEGVGVALSEVVVYEPRDVYRVDPAFRRRVSEMMRLFDDPERHAEGVALIERFGRHASPFLLQRVMNPEGVNRHLALGLVFETDPEAARRAVSQLLASERVSDVLLALGQLREHPEIEEAATLSRLLRHDSRVMVRRAAFFALAAHPPTEGWRALLEGTAEDPDARLRGAALRGIAHVDAAWAEEALRRRVGAGDIDDARLALELLVAPAERPFAPVRRTLRALPDSRLAELLPVLGARVRPETTAFLVDLLVAESSHTLYRPLHAAFDLHGQAGLAALMARVEASGDASLTISELLVARADAVAPLVTPVLARAAGREDNDDLVQALIEVVDRARAAAGRDAVVRVFTDLGRRDRVRGVALACLGRLEPTRLTRALVRGQVLADRSAFRASAYRAAIDMDLAEVVPEVRARLAVLPPRLWDPLAVEVVTELGGPDDLAFLIDRYLDANRPSQVVILEGAYRAGTTPGVRLLIDAAAGPDRSLRRFATRHLAEARP